MDWVEVFAVFVVCHLAGDFLVQTDWQATHKRAGLGRDRQRRAALLAHASTYTLTYLPALVWLAGDVGAAGAAAVAAGIFVPHLVQDDGRLVGGYVRRVKHTDPQPGMLMLAVDQSFHILALFGLALAAAA